LSALPTRQTITIAVAAIVLYSFASLAGAAELESRTGQTAPARASAPRPKARRTSNRAMPSSLSPDGVDSGTLVALLQWNSPDDADSFPIGPGRRERDRCLFMASLPRRV